MNDLHQTKALLRKTGRIARRDQPDKDGISKQILSLVLRMPQYANATTVLWYVDCRNEVRTRHALVEQLYSDKVITVPYCERDRLKLFRLESWDQLELGSYSILEPRASLRRLASHQVGVSEIDLVFVPGVAFDRSGGRIGNGKGYYDKLLSSTASSTFKVGLAFECQLVHQVPLQWHDVRMDAVVTEACVYEF